MRIAPLLAASLLVAGCSHEITGHPERTSGATSHASAPTPSPGKAAVPSAAPSADAPIADVIAWIDGGSPADPAGFHRATRNGVTTELGDDIAFSVGKVTCMTDTKHTGGALACLVDLVHPPPRPATAYGHWEGGWVDFDGASLQVGSARADPGPFARGDGPELPAGKSLSFSDYRCRADQDAVVCVNYAHRSAVRLAAAGVQPFGCLQSAPPPDGVGEKFSC
ncbi:hypothetical protein [Mycobacterium branderi]|uniref:Lipoprotein LppI n=1 Tax=Mycobacterium branderi TaxID=43348 RepID=A0A7I7WAM3_9MYCO|nr:hypothetical protein [Mycobacterium branderi]MCV7231498.1 hypothetical protein [Mycobacterium branderi]ORA37423.1 hypothetical protein BST20_13285 [Mycobacterium branderi]BBZ13561.1 hypothetical protein MBRA_37560 [Mycobacterium branderi]